MEGWVKVYSSNDLMMVKNAEDILKLHNIVSHIPMDGDSAFPMLSQPKLLVREENAAKAKEILDKELVVDGKI